jgi:cobalamin biosynthesis protein CobD/CbiB
MTTPQPPDDERRRLFRRMEWTFVYGPPLIALFIAVFGAMFIAWLVAIPGTTFWLRWIVLVLVLLGIPIAWQVIQRMRE